MIVLIWAENKDHGIAKNGSLPWKIKSEMQHFKNTTQNKTVIMGRKTLESIGKKLPNRKNIVLTTNEEGKKILMEKYSLSNDEIYYGKDSIKKVLNDYNNHLIGDDIYIIGGKSIYEEFIKYADKLIISIIKKNYDCDTFLIYDLNNFKLEDTQYNDEFDVLTYIKK